VFRIAPIQEHVKFTKIAKKKEEPVEPEKDKKEEKKEEKKETAVKGKKVSTLASFRKDFFSKIREQKKSFLSKKEVQPEKKPETENKKKSRLKKRKRREDSDEEVSDGMNGMGMQDLDDDEKAEEVSETEGYKKKLRPRADYSEISSEENNSEVISDKQE
jgi:hypothetical protein